MDLSGKKALGRPFTKATLVAIVVALLITCARAEAGSAKVQETATSVEHKSLGTEGAASEAAATARVTAAWNMDSGSFDKGSASYSRFHVNSCKFRPSVCANHLVPGSTCCGVACVDVHSHPLHCGRCNNVCGAGHACCAGTCKNLSDNNHCGRCNNRCAFGLLCAYGLCGY